MKNILQLNQKDNIVCALSPLKPKQKIEIKGKEIEVLSDIPVGHKISINKIKKGDSIIKYGQIIGFANKDIEIGEHVHVHNVEDPVSNWKEQNPLTEREEKVEWNLRDIKEKMGK